MYGCLPIVIFLYKIQILLTLLVMFEFLYLLIHVDIVQSIICDSLFYKNV